LFALVATYKAYRSFSGAVPFGRFYCAARKLAPVAFWVFVTHNKITPFYMIFCFTAPLRAFGALGV